MSLIIIIVLYLITSLILKSSIDFFKNSRLLDVPSERSNHNKPKPKGAGLILIPLIIFATLLVFFLEKTLNNSWLVIFGFTLILTIISFLDDLKSISSRVRLIFQIFCVLSSLLLFKDDLNLLIESRILNFISYEFSSLKPIIVLFFLTIVWVWIINLFNFMDGMDGITSVQVISLAIFTNILAILDIIEINFLYFSLILFAIFMAFLTVNKPPAKIFLGDVGSIPIGFLVGFLVIYNVIKTGLIIPFVIIIMYYLLDSTITLFKRILNGENIFQAHSNHFYQKILRKGFSHNYVLRKITILNFLLLLLSMASIRFPIISVALATILTAILLMYFNSRKFK